MAHCNEYLDLISAGLDGALTPEEAARLEHHLKECPECRQLKAELEAVHAALQNLPNLEPPAGLCDRIMEAVAADKVVPFAPKKPRRAWQKWAAAAAMFAVVLAGYGSLNGATKGTAPASGEVKPEMMTQTSGVAESLPQGRSVAPGSGEDNMQVFSDEQDGVEAISDTMVSPADLPDSPVQNNISPRETEAVRKTVPAPDNEESPEPQATMAVRSFVVTDALAPNEEGEEETMDGDTLDTSLFMGPSNEIAPIMEMAPEGVEDDTREENEVPAEGEVTAQEALEQLVAYIFEYSGYDSAEYISEEEGLYVRVEAQGHGGSIYFLPEQEDENLYWFEFHPEEDDDVYYYTVYRLTGEPTSLLGE